MMIEDNNNMNKCGVYIIINMINNTVYIGCTRTTFNHRYKTHVWALKNNRHENKHLQRAYNKYGDDNFKFIILDVIDDVDLIYNREKERILEYKNKNYKMYNMTSGGEGLHDLPDEIRKYIGELNRQRLTGCKLSEETKKRMSESRKGRKPSAKSLQLLAEYNKTKKLTNEQKEYLSMMFSGENSNFSKYTNEDILNIKQMLMDDVCIEEIADKFNTSKEYIKSIQYERRWKYIYPDGWKKYVKTLPHRKRISAQIKNDIYNDYYNNHLTKAEINKKYKVSYDTINKIINI